MTVSTVTALSLLASMDEVYKEVTGISCLWLSAASSDRLQDVSCVLQNMPLTYGSDIARDYEEMTCEEFNLLTESDYNTVVEFLVKRVTELKLGGQKLPLYGQCTYCGAIEVELKSYSGTKDYSAIGESSRYPIGFGCELCS
jgi:hypothetical protein